MIFANVQFRAFDYDGFKQSLFQMAVNEFPNWTDSLESNEGVMFVEWLAYLAANTCFQQNFNARNNFVPTATEAKSIAKLAKQFAYPIPNNAAAVVDVTIGQEEASPFPNSVFIPAGTQLLTQGTEQIIFETTQDLTIPASSSQGTVPAANHETKVEQDTPDGTADYKFQATYGPYVEGSIAVTVGGTPWVFVDNFLDSSSVSEHFRIEVDSSGIMSIIFGDGTNGKIPANGDDVEYTYKVGGGAQGNVPPGTITEIPGVFYDSLENVVNLVVTNSQAADGGIDRESIERTKIRMPASLGSKDATIDYEDFIANVSSVPGVSRVSILTVNDDPLIPENTAMIFVLPENSDTISQALEDQILAVFEENPTTLTLRVVLINPAFKTVEIDVRDLVIEDEDEDDTGVFASATIEIINNTFDVGDKVTVNGVDFTQGVDWTPGVSAESSATALRIAINASVNPLLQDIEADVEDAIVTVKARTKGEHGNAYTLAKSDGVTSNITISGALFANGEDSTNQTAVREAIDAFFGREAIDEEGQYTIDFGKTVFRNRLIWLIQDLEQVASFELASPLADVTLENNQFPIYTLKFSTS